MIPWMSIGQSGRIVIEVEPETKRRLYSALGKEGLTLKEWFLRAAEAYIDNSPQLSLPLVDENKTKTD